MTLRMHSLRSIQHATIAAAIGSAASVAGGATITVTSTADDGSNGTLRWAISEANNNAGDDTIVFDSGVTGTITLLSALPSIDSNIIIDGPGAGTLSIDGDDQFRVFFINSGTVTIQDLTITGGRGEGGRGGHSRYAGAGGGAAGMGGAVFVNAGSVTVRNVSFVANSALGGAGGSGHTVSGSSGGGGGGVGGIGEDYPNGPGGDGGDGGPLGGTGGAGGAGTVGAAGGVGAGGGGGDVGSAGGAGGFAGGGGGGGELGAPGGNGGFGGGGGGSGDFGTTGGTGGTFAGNGGVPGPYGGGGGGGGGLGGALFARAGTTTLISCIFNSNSATGGNGGSAASLSYYGTDGQGKGGAIFVYDTATVRYAGLTFGTGGSANSAGDAGSSGTDNADVCVHGSGTYALAFPMVLSITPHDATPTNSSSVSFDVELSESVTGVGTADFALTTTGVSGAAITGVTGSGDSYNVTVNTGAGSGSIRLDFVDDDSVIGDSTSLPVGDTGTGNGNYTSGTPYTIDKIGPAVTTVNVVNATTIDVTFDGTVSSGGGTASNYAISGTGVGTFATNPNTAVNQSGNTWRLTWNSGEMKIGGDVTITVANVQDALGNAIPSNGNSQTDAGSGFGTRPDIASVDVQTSRKVRVQFDESVAGQSLIAANYTVSGSGQGSLAANPDIVATISASTVELTWTAGDMFNGGDVNITVFNVEDLAGNSVDSAGVSGHDVGGAVGSSPTVVSIDVLGSSQIDITFSEAMNTSDATTPTNYSISGAGIGTLTGHPTSVAAQSADTYRLTWTPGEMKNGASVVITVADAVRDVAGNAIANPKSASSAGIGIGPAVSLATSAAAAVNAAITVDVSVEEGGATLDETKFATTNAAVENLQLTATGYTFQLTPVTEGAFNVQWQAGALTDAAGNTSPASNTLERTFDVTAPTATITPITSSPTNAADIVFQVVFSEAVTGFDAAGDVTVAHDGTANTGVSIAAVDASTYTVTVTGVSGSGAFTVSVIAAAATDAAGNPSTAVGPSAAVAISAPTPEPTPAKPSLSVTIEAEAGEIIVGEQVTFIVSISNDGAGGAGTVVLRIPMPPNAKFISAELIAEDSAFSTELQAVVENGVILLQLGQVPANTRYSVALVLQALTEDPIKLDAVVSSADVAVPVWTPRSATVSVKGAVETAEFVLGQSCGQCGALGLMPLALLLQLTGIRLMRRQVRR